MRALRSGWIAPLGPDVDACEVELAAYTGRKCVVALSSGTAALHLALITMGVGAGNLVLTSTMTFAATANAIRYTGAEPVFVDADLRGNMSPELLDMAMETLAAEGKQARAVIPVDMFGRAVDHESTDAVPAAHGVPILSNAAESLGAFRNGRSSGAFGVAAAISFNGNKIMTTSGGGALLTDDADMAQHIRCLATQARQPAAYYEHTDIGYNYRLSNLLAALGRAQLSRLESMIQRRRLIRLHYRELFSSVPGVSVLEEPPEPTAGKPATISGSPPSWWTKTMPDSLLKINGSALRKQTLRHARSGSRCIASQFTHTAAPSPTARVTGCFAMASRCPAVLRSNKARSPASTTPSLRSWVTTVPRDTRRFDAAKRAVDATVAALGLVVTSPLQLATAGSLNL